MVFIPQISFYEDKDSILLIAVILVPEQYLVHSRHSVNICCLNEHLRLQEPVICFQKEWRCTELRNWALKSEAKVKI